MFRSNLEPDEQGRFATFRRRKSVDLAAVVITRRRRNSVRMLNVSSGGAMLSGARELLIDERLVLVRGRYRLAAKVVWKSKGRAGLQWVKSLKGDKLDGLTDQLESDQRNRSGLIAQWIRGCLDQLKGKAPANDAQPIRRMPF